MSGTPNPLVKAIIDQLTTDTVLFHKCPYKGRVVIDNLRMKNDKFFSVYSSGAYRAVMIISDKSKGALVDLTIDTIINSRTLLG
jgi:Protein of unknown function (DUF1091)